jgi:hypothetical protein
MPKKNRHVQRVQSSPFGESPLSSSPSAQETPDIPPRALDLTGSSPYDDFDQGVGDRSEGFGHGEDVDAHSRAPVPDQRPSPLSLSPVSAVPATTDLVDVGTSGEHRSAPMDIGHTRSPVLVKYVPHSSSSSSQFPRPFERGCHDAYLCVSFVPT